jgi:hypothetical protein
MLRARLGPPEAVELLKNKVVKEAVHCNSGHEYSGPASYDRLDIRPTWVTTKIFVLTYDQISSYDPRQRQRGEHISDITCSSLRALAVFALFCRRDHANSSYQVCIEKQISSYKKRVCIAQVTF